MNGIDGCRPPEVALLQPGERVVRAVRETDPDVGVRYVTTTRDALVARTGPDVPAAVLLPVALLGDPLLARFLARRPDVAVLAVADPVDSPAGDGAEAGIRAHELLHPSDLVPDRLGVRVGAALARVRTGVASRRRSSTSIGPLADGRPAGRGTDRRRTDRRIASDAELRLSDALGRAVRPSLSRAAARAAVMDAVRTHADAERVRLVGPECPGDGGEIDALVERCLIDGRARVLGRHAAVPLELADGRHALVVEGLGEAVRGASGWLQRAAAQASVLLERARLHAESHAETRRSDALLEIDRALGTETPLDERLCTAMNLLAEAFDAGWALLYEVDLHRRVLVRAVQSTLADVAIDQYAFDELENTLAWRCTLAGESILCPADRLVRAEDPAVERRNRAAGVGATLICPLRPRGDRIGCLVLVRRERDDGFERVDLDACREVADRLSMIVERAELMERVARLAGCDALTGLANRRRFEEALARRCEATPPVPFSLLFIDLDGFKHVNDSLGHETGDRLLEVIATRLRDAVGPDDLLARLGGDEFAVLLAHDPVTGDRSRRAAGRVLELVRAPVPVADQRLHVGASIGVAHYPGHARDASELLRAADAAMYLAKREGRGRVREWSPSLARRAVRRLAVESSLRACIEGDADDLSLVFQPQLSVGNSGQVTGAEVFARWEDSRLGAIEPAEFIAVAEQSRLLAPLSDWLLEHTCAAAARLADGPPNGPSTGAPRRASTLTLWMNVPASVLADRGFASCVEAAVRRHGIDPAALGVEVGESGLMHDIDALIERLHALRTLGVRVALDDFGTGRSALRHLVRLPLHTLKIDRTFVARLGEHHEHDVLVRTMLEMANDLELDTVAEGVETPRQLERLRELGCDAAQGWLLARPEPLEALAHRLSGPAEPRRRAA